MNINRRRVPQQSFLGEFRRKEPKRFTAGDLPKSCLATKTAENFCITSIAAPND
jgi:hypothetical protein